MCWALVSFVLLFLSFPSICWLCICNIRYSETLISTTSYTWKSIDSLLYSLKAPFDTRQSKNTKWVDGNISKKIFNYWFPNRPFRIPFGVTDSIRYGHKHYNQKRIKQIKFNFNHHQSCVSKNPQQKSHHRSQPSLYRNWDCKKCGLWVDLSF